jgi:hypothetical protein
MDGWCRIVAGVPGRGRALQLNLARLPIAVRALVMYFVNKFFQKHTS